MVEIGQVQHIICNHFSETLNEKMSSNSDQYSQIKTETCLDEQKKKNSLLSMRLTQQPIRWFVLVRVVLSNVVALYGFLVCIHQFKLLTIIWMIFFGYSSGFGITAGAHRLWSHRSYKAKLPLRIILLLLYSMAGLHSVYRFVKYHRTHHKYADTDADPHNASRGFWYSHVGWIIQQRHPDFIDKEAKIDMSDITNDPLLEFQRRYYLYFKLLLCFVLPTIVPIWLWNESWFNSVIAMVFMRYMFILNATFTVNSIAHWWGCRPYNKKIKPAENAVVAFFTIGEGWHNYHHTFPWDYRASEFGVGKYNLTTALLDLFRKIGWVYDVKIPSAELIKKTMDKQGDGSLIYEVPIEHEDSR